MVSLVGPERWYTPIPSHPKLRTPPIHFKREGFSFGGEGAGYPPLISHLLKEVSSPEETRQQEANLLEIGVFFGNLKLIEKEKIITRRVCILN